MLQDKIQPASAKELYLQFKQQTPVMSSEILHFGGVGHKDVYNPTIPFLSGGKVVIAGRVEERDSEDSQAVFFSQQGHAFLPVEEAPYYQLQDPFVTKIHHEIIFGGVRVIWENGRITSWVTDFYRGTDIFNLTYFASGPPHMKDIRLVQLFDGRIGIFTRPQGEEIQRNHGCIARIGFTTAANLETITPELIRQAPTLEGNFLPDEWGGVNQALLLPNGLIGIIGHISYREIRSGQEIKHYYSSALAFDPSTYKMTPTKVICARDCFPPGPAKRFDLQDITFTSGIIRNPNGTAHIYAGLNDCQVGRAVIVDPLKEYEEL